MVSIIFGNTSSCLTYSYLMKTVFQRDKQKQMEGYDTQITKDLSKSSC